MSKFISSLIICLSDCDCVEIKITALLNVSQFSSNCVSKQEQYVYFIIGVSLNYYPCEKFICLNRRGDKYATETTA